MEQRVTIGEGGRIVIPAQYRKEMHVMPGDELIMRMHNGELRLFNQVAALDRIQQAVKPYKGNVSATDDFIALRKKDSGE